MAPADDEKHSGERRHSTAILLSKLREGDAAAADELATRYGAVLRRIGGGRLPAGARERYETEELVQDTLLKGIAKATSFENRGPGAFLAYLRQILLNLIRDEVRRAARRPDRAALPDRLPDFKPTPQTQLIKEEDRARFEEALATLPEAQAEAVLLRVEGHSYGEIARMTGRPTADAARMMVKRGFKLLAEQMQGGGPTA